MMSSADEDAYRHFKETLEADLRQNIKPVIISLTMLAEDYKQSSQVIAKSIEEYIIHVPAEIKILGLYLMDSIMKNLKYTTNYTTIFEKSMVNLFIRVFECVDEQNRKALYKLRQTWNEVFSNRLLYEIDVSVKKIDPAWPITANLSSKQQAPSSNEPYSATSSSTSTSSAKSSPPNSNKSILINQTNILSPPNSQTTVGQLQTVNPLSQQQTSVHLMNKSTSNNNTNNNGPTSTSNTTNLVNKTVTNSQEIKQQSLQQQSHQSIRTSPNLLNKESTGISSVKKVLEFNVKKSTNIDIETANISEQAIRDPRLIQRKNKPCQSSKFQESMETSPVSTASNTSPLNKKKQQVTQQAQSSANDKHSLNSLKRSSPSSSSIQNAHEIKKPKLTQQTNGESKVSPNKPHVSPSKQNVNTKFGISSPPTAKNQQNSSNNKIPKTALHNDDIEDGKLKQINQAGNKSNKNLSKQEDRPVINPSKASINNKVSNLNKSEKNSQQSSELNSDIATKKQQVKTIPSLFDIQITPNLAATNSQPLSSSSGHLKKQSSSPSTDSNTLISGKQKQNFNSNKPVNQMKPKSNQQQLQSKQQAVRSGVKKSSDKIENINKQQQQKKINKSAENLSKQNNEGFIFGNDEDVDERFSYSGTSSSNNTNKNLKIDDLTQQLKKLSDLISTTNTNTVQTIVPITSLVTNPAPVNSDLLANLFDSNNKLSLEPNVLALITAKKQTQQLQQPIQPVNAPTSVNPIDKLASNKQSLNELEKRLLISKQNDQANNETQSSTNTQELIEMIRTLIKQQQMLLEQQQTRQEANQSKTNDSPVTTNMGNQYNEDNQNMSNNPDEEHEEEEEEENFDNDKYLPEDQQEEHQQSYYEQVVAYEELPPIKPRDKNENLNDSLLVIDGRSYRIQPEVRRLIKVYYHDHELFCDTRTKEVFVDQKRVYKMGEPTKEIMLNGRRVRLMYMGRRIELWIDGLSYHFRADSPPKQISVSSSTNQIKRYYVTIDSRTMDMFFDNYKVCQINGGSHGSGPSKLMVQLAPNDFELHEISFVCPPKRIMIDGVPRTMRYDLPVPCIEMSGGLFYVIRFSGKPREIYIDEIPYTVPFDKTIRIKLNGRAHELAWGGPGFEVIIDGRPYELQFNKPSREIIIGTRPHFIYICGDAPDVKICGQLPYELLNQQKEQLDDETEQSKIIKSLPSLMQPIQTSNFMMQQSSNQPQSSSTVNQSGKAPDLQELIKSLMDHKLIKPVNKNDNNNKTPLDSLVKNILLPKHHHQNNDNNDREIEKLPDLTNFDIESLKKTYTGAIQSLYSGHQCATCGNRFNQNDLSNGSGNSRYRKHLDWHFRQNRREKDEINKAHSRAWYYILQDWIQYEELSEDSANNSGNDGNEKQSDRNGTDSNDDGMDFFNENGGVSKNSINAFNTGTTCPATDDIDDKCYVCQDPFEIFFHEEKDEWHFKDAIRVDSRVYHPICFEDAREDQSISINNRSLNDDSMLMENNNVYRVKNEPTNSQLDDQNMSQTDEPTTAETSIIEPFGLGVEPAEMMVMQNERVHNSQKNNHLKNEPKTP